MLPQLPRAWAVGMHPSCLPIAAGRDLALPQDSAILPHKQQLPLWALLLPRRRQRTEKSRGPQGRSGQEPQLLSWGLTKGLLQFLLQSASVSPLAQ